MLFHVCAVIAIAVCAEAKFYTDCGSKLATIQSVGVVGCADDAKECILKRDSNVTILINLTPYSSKLATIQSVGVVGCADDAKECILKRDSNVTILINLTPSRAVDSIDTVVHGIIMNLPVPFPLSQPDACKDSGLTCPLKPAVPVSYKATLPVLKSYPRVKVDVKWQLQNDQQDLVCIIIIAKIH